MISIHEQINVAFGYLHSLWRYRWSALLVAWLVAIVGGVFVYSMPNTYEAKTTVHIDTSSVMQPLLAGLAMEASPRDEMDVMQSLLLSRDNLLQVIRETDMDLTVDNPQAREKMVRGLANSISLNRIGDTRRRTSGSSLYEISYQSASAEQAFKVVFNLLNTLMENTLNSGRMDTEMAEDFLNVQIKDYERRLEQSEERLAEFKKKNSGFMPNEQGGYYARLSSQQQIIDSTKSALLQAKQRYNELRQQLSGETPMLANNAYSQATAAKLRRYQEQLNDMLSQFTDAHPDVKAMRARIEDLQNGIDPDGDSASFASGADAAMNPVYQDLKAQESRARIEVSTLQVQLAEQSQKLAELQQSMDIIPQVEADLVRLNRDYDITKQRYLALVERRESARMAQQVEKNNSALIFRVLQAPVVPLLPAGPNRPILLAGVFLAALAAGFGWCVLRFLLYPTFVDYKQLQKMIDLPVLGTISLQMTPAKRRQRRLDMASFMMVVILMFGFFGGVVLYQQQGSLQARQMLAEIWK